MLTRSGLGAVLTALVAGRIGLVVGVRGAGDRRRGDRRRDADRRLGVATSAPGHRHATPRRARGSPRRPDPARLPTAQHRLGSDRDAPRSSTAATARRRVWPIGSVLAHSATVARRCRSPRSGAGVFDVGPLDIERIDPFWLTIGTRRTDQTASVVGPPEGVRPGRPAGRRADGRERVGPAARHRRPDVGIRLDARIRPRRRPADDPLADLGPGRDADGARTRRGPTPRVHRRARHVGDGRDAPRTSRNWSTSPQASRSTPSAPASTSSSARPTAPMPAARSPLIAESMVLDLLTPVQQSIDDDLLPVASLFTGGFDHTSVLIVTGPIGPVEPVRRGRPDDGRAHRRRRQRRRRGSRSMAESASEFVDAGGPQRDRTRPRPDRSARGGVRRARRRRVRDLRFDRVGPDRHARALPRAACRLLAGARARLRSARRGRRGRRRRGDRGRLGRRQRRRLRRGVHRRTAAVAVDRMAEPRTRRPRRDRRAPGWPAMAAGAALLATWRRWHLLPLAPVVVAYVGVVALVVAARACARSSSSSLCAIVHPVRHAARRRQRPRTLAAPARRATTDRARSPSPALLGVRHQRLRCRSPTRADPRANDPAQDTAALLDPIEATIALRALDPPIDLHEITATDGSDELPARWRTAALEEYDGRRWTPVLTLRPIGSTLGPVTGPTISADISFLDDDLSLVPFPGSPVSVDAPVETDRERTVVRLAERPDARRSVGIVSNVRRHLALDRARGVGIGRDRSTRTVAGLTGFAESLGRRRRRPDACLEQLTRSSRRCVTTSSSTRMHPAVACSAR